MVAIHTLETREAVPVMLVTLVPLEMASRLSVPVQVGCTELAPAKHVYKLL